MKYNVYLLFLFGLCGCGILNQTTKTTELNKTQLEHNATLALATVNERTNSASYLTKYTDSANHQYSVQFWPKGHFTFSATNGFEGEAERVLVSGSIMSRDTGSGLVTVQNEQKTSLELKQQEQEKLETSRKEVVKKSSVSLKWIIIAGILLLALTVFIYYKIKS